MGVSGKMEFNRNANATCSTSVEGFILEEGSFSLSLRTYSIIQTKGILCGPDGTKLQSPFDTHKLNRNARERERERERERSKSEKQIVSENVPTTAVEIV